MQNYYYDPEVKILLINQSDEKVQVHYNESYTFTLPFIGIRPPYYIHPRYEPEYPVI